MSRAAAVGVLVIVAGLPAFAADHWLRIASPDFELFTTAGEKRGVDTIGHLEQVRAFFLQASPVRSLGDFPLRIFQFDTAAQYEPYRQNAFTIAYFVATPASEYIVMGDRVSARQPDGAYGASIHEYMHLIVRHSGLKLPTWLNEGWADVFSTLRSVGKDTAVGDLLPDRMKSLETEEWLDFDTLTSVNGDSSIYHEASRVGIFYAESWALAHMLYLSPEYKDNFGKFVTALNSGKSSAEACQLAYGRSAAAVFADLRTYFSRKRLFGTVFETRIASGTGQIASAALQEFDARLALADLKVAIGKRNEAQAEYAGLEKEQPDRVDVSRAIGNLALWNKDAETARRYFTKAFDAGGADAQMCLQLAVLERQAKQPSAKIIPILERAVQSKPNLTEARVELGLMRIDTRDYPGAVSTLMAIPNITPQQATAVFCGLAYSYVQTGDIENGRKNAEDCRKWSKTDLDQRRAAPVLRFVEARSKPAAGVRPAERLQRVSGTAQSLECSPEGNRLQIVVADKIAIFDFPERDAIEMPVAPRASLTLQCGTLKPVRIGVEFAPPRSAMETSVGIVRRLEY